MSNNQQLDRFNESKNNLYTVLKQKGTIWTLGMCMGILARLSVKDTDLYLELKHRAKSKSTNL